MFVVQLSMSELAHDEERINCITFHISVAPRGPINRAVPGPRGRSPSRVSNISHHLVQGCGNKLHKDTEDCDKHAKLEALMHARTLKYRYKHTSPQL